MANHQQNPASIHLTEEALAHSERLSEHLRELISQAGGWLSFAHWMQEALYAPGLGYYAAGTKKLATRDTLNLPQSAAGDFVTAPELSKAFGYTLAKQVEQVLQDFESPAILEFGAGSGQLAHDVLTALAQQGLHPSYQILEVSADLAERQRGLLQKFNGQVHWINELPKAFEGMVLANEVLDAMPAHIVGWTENGDVFERGVVWADNQFAWQDRPANDILSEALKQRMPCLPGYVTEINLQAQAWTSELAHWLKRGVAILIDYGFPQHEYYHPQRREGTLMCHIQHRSHANALLLPGLQDITTHVDFTAIADAAHEAGLSVMGYTSQARFLVNASITDQIAGLSSQDLRGIDKLLSEAEMGELFKVLAVGRDVDQALIGFCRGDRLHQL